MKGFLKKGDIIIIAFVLVFALLFYVPIIMRAEKSGAVIADVIADGKEIESVNLSEVESPYDIEVNGTTIRVEPGKIKFTDSDCRDKICIEMGELTRSGQMASCVPKKVTIKLRSLDNGSGGIDAVTY